MLNRLDLRGVPADELPAHLPRPELAGEEPVAAVREILADVAARGDDALIELTERFDGARLARLDVPPEERAAALERIPAELRTALEVAADRVREFHLTQVRADHRVERDGVVVEALVRPVDRAGLYVPGGRASYPSTVLHTAIPAKVAGVGQLVLCVPPDRATGRVADVTLAAAAIAGVDELYAVGGAQAIGAMAYGTATIGRVDVIAGPGNVYVALAKRLVADRVGIAAAFAGPSEVVVVADASIDPELAAIDVILQAEHGPDGLAWLVTWDEAVADAVTEAVERLVGAAPRHHEIAATLDAAGHAALVDSPEMAMAVSNLIAPEHLELLVDDPRALLPLVRHAGAVFCGPWSPASFGDYLAGPSHVLPTDGTARFSSALTVADFTKDIHVVTVSPDGFDALGPHVVTLAAAEGLDAHAESVRLRQARR
ncbi:MAG TPA: histidinol dehydrogenase [Acidimicrobiales bacterium]|nr:histidinol dehydrogenase [Acidimicrobiales bacterium]